jgi:hypothetical protein
MVRVLTWVPALVSTLIRSSQMLEQYFKIGHENFHILLSLLFTILLIFNAVYHIFGNYPLSCLFIQNMTSRRLDYESIFRWNLFCLAKQIELQSGDRDYISLAQLSRFHLKSEMESSL